MKVLNQVSLIDLLIFKQQKTIWVWDTDGKNDSLKRKFIKNHHMVVTSLVKHTPSPISNHLEFTWIWKGENPWFLCSVKKSVLYNVLSKILLIFYQCAINCLMFSYNVFMWEIRFIYWMSFRNMMTWVGYVIVLAQWKTPFPGLCCISWEVKISTLLGK